MSEFVPTPLKYLALGRITNGVGLPAEHDNPDWPRYIRTTDIAGARRLREDTWYSQPADLLQKAEVRKNDLLLTNAGMTIGKSYLHEEDPPAVYAGYLTRVRPNPAKVDARYLAYFTESKPYWDQINIGATRSTIDNFSSGKYQNLIVSLPPLEQQRRIADYLDTETARIEALLDKNARQKALVQERAQREMLDIIGDWRTTETWTLRQLGCRVLTGPFGTVLSANEYLAGGVPVINPSHIQGRAITPETHIAVSKETAQRLSRYRLYVGDLVLGRKGDVGRAAIVSADQEGWICGSDSLVIRVDRGRVLPEWLVRVTEIGLYRQQLSAAAVGATMASLNEPTLLGFRVSQTTVDHQEAQLRALRECEELRDGWMALLDKQRALLGERREALVTAAVTGELEI